MTLLITRHIYNLFFANRKYHCKVLSRSKNAAYIQLNNCKIITIIRRLAPNLKPNPVTAVIVKNGAIPRFSYKIYKTKNINSIRWKKINAQYIKQIKTYLKKAPNEGIKQILSVNACRNTSMRHKLSRLKEYFVKNKPDKFFDILCKIAGAGPGLTPSTDDFICGIISVLKILNYKIPFLKIARETLKRTTKISWYYIVLAMMGYCADWQYDILKAIGQSGKNAEINLDVALKNINFGHTSGNDWLYGVYFAVNFLKVNLAKKGLTLFGKIVMML